jgi:NTE family protein
LPLIKWKSEFQKPYPKECIINLLSRITRNSRHIKDFNKLPFLFLCIGTNIETGEQVVLNKGNLAQAMIASQHFHCLAL